MTEDREMARRLQSSWQRGSSSTAVSGRAMPGAEGRSSDTSGISNAQEKPAAVCRPETSSTAARAARKFAFSSLAEVEVRVTAPDFEATTRTLRLDYGRPVTRLDVRLDPS